MKTFSLDPVRDPRWERFVDRHPQASIFHTRGWLEALERTYGYTSVAYTTASESEELQNGLVFCRIESLLTGRRLVSLPFSDHCQPLVETQEEWESLMATLIDGARSRGYKYVQIRPLTTDNLVPGKRTCMVPDRSFYLHTIDIDAEPAELFKSFHRSNVQRKIRRAEREGISSNDGRSPELLSQFYELLIRTRRRHRIPPQPLKWFQNLVDCLAKRLTIRVASKDDKPIASILTLSFKQQLYYKYGCSDDRFHSLGGFHLLLWQAIKAEKERGARVLDMGRSDIEHASLVNFKERWGGTRTLMPYYRYPPTPGNYLGRKWAEQVVGHVLARLPDSILTAVGELLYPHIG